MSQGIQILGTERECWEIKLQPDNFICLIQINSNEKFSFLVEGWEGDIEKVWSFLTPKAKYFEEIKIVGPFSIIQQLKIQFENQEKLWERLIFVPRELPCDLRYWPSHFKVQGSVAKQESESLISQKNHKIKVLVVDDSKTVRNLLSKIISSDPRLEVVATAERPGQVLDLIARFKPDVITLDIHMPEMTGVELLKTVISPLKIPTIMITSISKEEGPLVMEALHYGAFDYIKKPSLNEISEVGEKIIETLVAASRSGQMLKVRETKKIDLNLASSKFHDRDKGIILIGSSTGGTQALQHIFENLPDQIPPILVVQHIPAIFSKALADRLNGLCPFTVKEAENGDKIIPNTIYIAPGGKQMGVKSQSGVLTIFTNEDEPVNRFRPSVDYLFKSYHKIFDRPTVGLILTGMGKDGAEGLLSLKEKGALTIAQDEASSVVFGMPKEAIRIGAACEVHSLENMAQSLVDNYNRLPLKKMAS